VTYEDSFIQAKVEIPRKCARCVFLGVDRIHGFHCRKDAEKWGDFHRGLDWGTWSPDYIYLELPLPKVSTRELSRLAHANDLLAFVQEHRRINPGLSLEEAKTDFERFRRIIEGAAKPHEQGE
jgi:hypothetical protein